MDPRSLRKIIYIYIADKILRVLMMFVWVDLCLVITFLSSFLTIKLVQKNKNMLSSSWYEEYMNCNLIIMIQF